MWNRRPVRHALSQSALLGLLCAPTVASAQVSKPLPGVTMVKHGGRVMVVADLCAPGVSVRATKYAERKKTPAQWAATTGVDVAVNADFFDFPAATKVVGRAKGAGEEWPTAAQFYVNDPRLIWQFGPGFSELTAQAPPPNAAATEIVGAHNQLVKDGKTLGPAFDGDGVLSSAARRTGIGVNRDHSKLYFYASNDAITGATMANDMIAYAAESGEGALDIASNEDGGGSSQMYVRGQGQVVDGTRQVANHLGIFTKGSGAAPQCPNRPPQGYLDDVDCTGPLTMSGWAQDPDEPQKAISVHFYFDGGPGEPQTTFGFDAGEAAVNRSDLCGAIGSCEHGFVVPTPFGLFDGKEHQVLAYGIDSKGGGNPMLKNSPVKVTCNVPALAPSVRRPVDAEAVKTWKFVPYRDVLVVSRAALEALPLGAPAPSSPVLVKSADAPEVWLVDGAARHHVTDRAAAAAWHFDLATVSERTATDIASLQEAAPLRSRPWLVKEEGSDALFLLDEPPGATSADGGTGTPGSPSSPSSPGASADDAAQDGGCSSAPSRASSALAPIAACAAFAITGLALRRRRRLR